MKSTLNDKEELITIGTPIKELTKLQGFEGLSAYKNILLPIKELTSNNGFDELSSRKDILLPIKEVADFQPLTPGPKKEEVKESKDKSNNNDEDQKDNFRNRKIGVKDTTQSNSVVRKARQ
ncbi:MAG: hypothetical protein H7Y18_00010 [Clostridiaceae bacterium]|nr:hypothetical protein [Clostridiaceae bacterium]